MRVCVLCIWEYCELYCITISENVKPDSSTWAGWVIPSEVEILTRKPERIGRSRDTLTHIDRNGHYQEYSVRNVKQESTGARWVGGSRLLVFVRGYS